MKHSSIIDEIREKHASRQRYEEYQNNKKYRIKAKVCRKSHILLHIINHIENYVSISPGHADDIRDVLLLLVDDINERLDNKEKLDDLLFAAKRYIHTSAGNVYTDME